MCYLHSFYARVRGYNERLSRQPTNPEEFVEHAALIAQVEAARPDMDKEYDHVSIVPNKYGVL